MSRRKPGQPRSQIPPKAPPPQPPKFSPAEVWAAVAIAAAQNSVMEAAAQKIISDSQRVHSVWRDSIYRMGQDASKSDKDKVTIKIEAINAEDLNRILSHKPFFLSNELQPLKTSLDDECAAQGKDWKEVFEQRAEEKRRLKELQPRRVIEVLLFALGLATIFALAYFQP